MKRGHQAATKPCAVYKGGHEGGTCSKARVAVTGTQYVHMKIKQEIVPGTCAATNSLVCTNSSKLVQQILQTFCPRDMPHRVQLVELHDTFRWGKIVKIFQGCDVPSREQPVILALLHVVATCPCKMSVFVSAP